MKKYIVLETTAVDAANGKKVTHVPSMKGSKRKGKAKKDKAQVISLDKIDVNNLEASLLNAVCDSATDDSGKKNEKNTEDTNNSFIDVEEYSNIEVLYDDYFKENESNIAQHF